MMCVGVGVNAVGPACSRMNKEVVAEADGARRNKGVSSCSCGAGSQREDGMACCEPGPAVP